MSFKFFTKTISIFIVATMLIGIMPAFAAYPTRMLTVPTTDTSAANLGISSTYTTENDAWSFTVNGGTNGTTSQSFVVLDEDIANNTYTAADGSTRGKYLIASNYKFGSRAFDTDSTLTSFVYNVNTTTSTGAEGTNIGYYVNTDLNSSGSGRGLYYLGNPMKSRLLEAEWPIEGTTSVTAKAVLPSYTEYITYNKRFDMSKVYNAAGGTWLRTPVYKTEGELTYAVPTRAYYTNGNFQVRTKSDATVSSGGDIQLVFWVDRDFFKEVKVTSAGTEIRNILKTLGLEELLATGYEVSELLALGLTADEIKGSYTVGELINLGLTSSELTALGYTENECFGYLKPSYDSSAVVITGTNHAASLFTAENKQYILLDKNDNDEFLIASNFKSSSLAFDSNAENNQTYTANYESWKYSTTDTNNIGYTVNNFATNYNYIGQKIAAKIQEKQWRVEQGSEFVTADETAVTLPCYEFSAKIVVPSLSEYIKYADKIDAYTINGGDGGIWTRTPISGATGADRLYRINASASTDQGKIGSKEAKNSMYYQFMFWVDRSFFTDIVISDAGTAVKSALQAEYTREELAVAYTDNNEALDDLGLPYDVVVNPVTLTAQAGTSTAKFGLQKYEGGTVTLIIARYNSAGVMKDVVTKSVALTADTYKNDSETEITLTGVELGETVKAFVWDSLTGLKPYAMTSGTATAAEG